MVPKKIPDLLRTAKIARAEEMLRSDDVPPIVRDGFHALKSEIIQMRLDRQIEAAKPKPAEKPVHPLAVGCSVGGIKEVCDYLFQLATASDPIGRDLLAMSVVDGSILAVISTVAAWITGPKGKKKNDVDT